MAEGTAEEESREGMKGIGEVSLSVGFMAGFMTGVEVDLVGEGVEEVMEEIGGLSDWAYRLQGWYTRRRREGRRLRDREDKDAVEPVLAIVMAIL